ncbi:hypothetical protein EJ02DRAFT_449861 [Clathrospora elynae]|uniref:Uncharacterized protein n=1 Tax=Clathrospora elynae TaxID=706981 RepID=A0A6A5T5Y2_9PLEO|nr:hypothetical protein EJ02DRAFT_449861 [Clathrospora elynae]
MRYCFLFVSKQQTTTQLNMEQQHPFMLVHLTTFIPLFPILNYPPIFKVLLYTLFPDAVSLLISTR